MTPPASNRSNPMGSPNAYHEFPGLAFSKVGRFALVSNNVAVPRVDRTEQIANYTDMA
jgi:hypothetical protein